MWSPSIDVGFRLLRVALKGQLVSTQHLTSTGQFAWAKRALSRLPRDVIDHLLNCGVVKEKRRGKPNSLDVFLELISQYHRGAAGQTNLIERHVGLHVPAVHPEP